MNQTAKDIYDQYRYELMKTLALANDTLERSPDLHTFEAFAARIERLESLIDLYAYLLAQHQH